MVVGGGGGFMMYLNWAAVQTDGPPWLWVMNMGRKIKGVSA